MSTAANKALYKRYIEECFNQGRTELLDELLAPDYVFSNAPPGTPPGAESVRQVIRMLHAPFPICASRSRIRRPRAMSSFRAASRAARTTAR